MFLLVMRLQVHVLIFLSPGSSHPDTEHNVYLKVKGEVAQWVSVLCDLMDAAAHQAPAVHGISSKKLGGLPFHFSGGSSQPRNQST